MKQRTWTFHQTVSIPMTVLGGLQFREVKKQKKENKSFNTDDGIRRATIFGLFQESFH